jgi:hypothetical protein
VEVEQLAEIEKNLATRMQNIIQFFLYILQVTVGDLTLEKCACYLICHRLKNGKERLLQPHEQHKCISRMERTTVSTSGIKRKAPEEGHINLGFHMTGEGTSSAHKKIMSEKEVLLGEATMGSSLWKSKSAVAYNSFYSPSLGYGMCTTMQLTKEREDIQRHVINAILPKMGIHRKVTHTVVFGMAQFGILGLDHLSTLQGHIRLKYIMGRIRCGDHTCQRMWMLIEYTQLECGNMENILEQDYEQLRNSNSINNKNWIKETWIHLHSCHSTVVVQQNLTLRLGCTNDIAIMDCLTASNQLTRGELQGINRCRIYLHAFFLSDIINIQGTLIEPWDKVGQRKLMIMTSWACPVQQRPTSWKAWKKALEILA